MDDPRDLVLVERAAERLAVRHVALDERDAAELILAESEPQARVVASQVVADRVLAVVQQGLDRPGAHAAERARDQGAIRQAARPGTR
jgi:hypothetical protein